MMASSRTMRSSHLANPLDATTRDATSLRREIHKVRDKQTSLENWAEPPLRTPAPSFEDYKGLERQGVLENMAPLGSFPNNKVKQRLKTLNGPRRSAQSKGALEEEAATPEPTAPPVSRRSEPRKSESRTSNLSSREKDEDRDYTPPAAAKSMSAREASSQITPNYVNSRSSTREPRLRGIVDAAVKRAEELKNPYLGKALKELYNRSLHDRGMAELLDAVLSQKPTEKQTSDFQAMVKRTRKELKDADKEAQRRSSKTPVSRSKSSLQSPARSDEDTAAQHGVNTEEPLDAPGSKTDQVPNPPLTKQRAKRMETNGTPSKGERPSKRMKRTYSNASSTSSLSSITSDNFQRSPRPNLSKDSITINLEDFYCPPPPLPPPEYRNIGLHFKLAPPKMHTFPLKQSKSTNKTSATSAAITVEEVADDLAVWRAKLVKDQEYTVHDSAVRDPPAAKAPQQRRKSHQIASPLPLRSQQTRLRNGVNRHEIADDHDLPSSGSSYHGELLAPPGADGHMVTRGTTPNQLGRPPKNVKKAARIKMS